MTGKTHNITVLPSGRQINANFGIIGITTNGPIHLGEGADGNPNFVQLRSEVEEHYMEPECYEHAPLSDKIALGQLMISRWQDYISQATAEEIGRGQDDTVVFSKIREAMTVGSNKWGFGDTADWLHQYIAGDISAEMFVWKMDVTYLGSEREPPEKKP